MYQYFNSKCFKGFGDDKDSFFTVYRIVFETIATEDSEYIEEDEFLSIPAFGTSKSNFEDVTRFYAYWESYSTKKSYSWLFTHDISEIRERRILKLVDKEHKKIQQKARKERNEEVRSLVLFVKKRDPRMAEYRKMLEEKAANNRLKSQQNRLEQIRKRTDEIREQQRNSKVHKEQDEQLKKLESEYLNQFSSSDDEETEDIEEGMEDCNINSDGEQEVEFDEDLYCVACNKEFKNISSKTNHDASKKHKQNVELLKSLMKEEEESYQKTVNGTNDDDEMSSEESEDVPTTSKSKSKKSKKKKAKKLQNHEEPTSVENHAESDTEVTVEEPIKLLESNNDSDEDWLSGKKGKKAKPKGKKEKPENVKEVVKEPPQVVTKPEFVDIEETIHKCATCKQVFQSKNKLFTHLKATNHSVYLGEVKQKTATEKSNSRKKK